MFNLILFGAPGSGKGTQSAKIVGKYRLKHISTGDLLRSEIAAGTPLGKEAQKYTDNSILVPDEIMIGMIGKTIEEHSDVKGFLFDGFPRTVKQAEALDDLLQQHGTTINLMISLDVHEEELVHRLLERGKTSGRPDDANEDKVRIRMEEYHKKTEAIEKYYAHQNKVKHLLGVGSIDDIFASLSALIDELL